MIRGLYIYMRLTSSMVMYAMRDPEGDFAARRTELERQAAGVMNSAPVAQLAVARSARQKTSAYFYRNLRGIISPRLCRPPPPSSRSDPPDPHWRSCEEVHRPDHSRARACVEIHALPRSSPRKRGSRGQAWTRGKSLDSRIRENERVETRFLQSSGASLVATSLGHLLTNEGLQYPRKREAPLYPICFFRR
jgi:hypothetical protein